jgi:VWFA-related protein
VAPHSPRLAAVSLAVGLAAAPAGAGQAVFSAQTSLVNVAVTVEDAQGRPIDGLTPRDFVVTEDGRRQKIEMCARMGMGANQSTSLDVALLVDTSDSMLETLRRVAGRGVRFLSSLPNAQEIIVVFFDQAQILEHFDREHPEALFERVRTLPEGGNTAVRDANRLQPEGPVGVERPIGARAAHGRHRHGERHRRRGARRAVQSHAVTINPVAYPASADGDGPDPQEAVKGTGPAGPDQRRAPLQAAQRGGASRRARRDRGRPALAIRPRLHTRCRRARPAVCERFP